MRLSSSCLRLQRPINFYFLLRSFVRNFVQLYLYILYVKPGSCPDRDTWKFCWSAVWSCTNKIWQHYQRTGIWSMPFLFNKATHCRSTPTIKTTERVTTTYWIEDEAGNNAYQNIDSHHLPGVHSSTIYCAARVTQEIGKDEERQWDGQEQSVYQAQHMLTRPVKFYYRSLREATH